MLACQHALDSNNVKENVTISPQTIYTSRDAKICDGMLKYVNFRHRLLSKRKKTPHILRTDQAGKGLAEKWQ